MTINDRFVKCATLIAVSAIILCLSSCAHGGISNELDSNGVSSDTLLSTNTNKTLDEDVDGPALANDEELEWYSKDEVNQTGLLCIKRQDEYAALNAPSQGKDLAYESFESEEGKHAVVVQFDYSDEPIETLTINQGNQLVSFFYNIEHVSFTAYRLGDYSGYCSSDGLGRIPSRNTFNWASEDANYDEAVANRELAINGKTISCEDPANNDLVRATINQSLSGSGVSVVHVLNSVDRFIGPKGDTVTFGYFEGNQWREFSMEINNPFQSYEENNPITLEQVRTKEGYCIIDTSPLEPGAYLIKAGTGSCWKIVIE